MDRLADEDNDDDETCKGLLGAAAQCIYLLYGLDLTERNEQWTDGFQVGIVGRMCTWDQAEGNFSVCSCAGSIDDTVFGA